MTPQLRVPDKRYCWNGNRQRNAEVPEGTPDSLPLCPPHVLHGPTTPELHPAIRGEKPKTEGLICLYGTANIFCLLTIQKHADIHSLNWVWIYDFIFQAVHDSTHFTDALTEQTDSLQLLEKHSVNVMSYESRKISLTTGVNCSFPNAHKAKN